MADAVTRREEEFRSTNQTAFVVGYTGETGQALVEELVNRNIFRKVLLIGRRKLNYEGEKYNKVEQTVVDYEQLDDHADLFRGHSVGFCCLGTTRGKAGVEGFRRVDHDYIMMIARLAKDGGCEHFLLQSAVLADKNSGFLYFKVKDLLIMCVRTSLTDALFYHCPQGQVEAECAEVGFQKLSVFRPALLLVNRGESRPGEWFLRMLLTPISYVAPTATTCPVATVAKAMVNALLSPSDKPVESFSNEGVHLLAKGKCY